MRRLSSGVLALVLAGSLVTAGAAGADTTFYGCLIGEGTPFVGLDPGQFQVGGDYCVFTALGPVGYTGTGVLSVRVLHPWRDRRHRPHIKVTVYRGKGPLTRGATRAVRGDTVVGHVDGGGSGLFVGGNG